MSLRTFHLFFIAVSILLAFGFGVWELLAYRGTGFVSDLLLGIASLAGGVVLILYFKAVLKKLRNMNGQ